MNNLRNIVYNKLDNTRPTKIVAAAVLKDGYVWTGLRHAELIHQVFEDTGKRVFQEEQGFWTDDNRFVMREAAAQVAWKAGQLPKDYPCNKVLLSEYLW